MAQAIAIAGAVSSFVSGMMNAFAEKKTAKINANAYKAQANNIAVQQDITKWQYATNANILQGNAITTAGRSGIKFTGTTAQSISRSLTQLNLDKGYEVFNLETERVKALNNAKYQKWVSDTALVRGFFSSSASALGSAGSSNFFSGGNQTGTINPKGKMSGGYDVSNYGTVYPTSFA